MASSPLKSILEQTVEKTVVYDVASSSNEDECIEIPKMGLWEKHTKGIGSKLLRKYGYVPGQPLGKRKNGIVEPIVAQVLPKGRSLDFIMKDKEVKANQATKHESTSTSNYDLRSRNNSTAAVSSSLESNSSSILLKRSYQKGQPQEPSVKQLTDLQLNQRAMKLKDQRKQNQDHRNKIQFDKTFKMAVSSKTQPTLSAQREEEKTQLEDIRLARECIKVYKEKELRRLKRQMTKF